MSLNRILITGGAGFIGSHLAIKYSQLGYQVVVLDNFLKGNKLENSFEPNIQLLEGDVRNKSTVMHAAKGCQTIIHLAAVVGVDEVINDPLDTVETETIGTANVVSAAIHHQVKKIIYTSSSAVYHKLQSDFNRETDELSLVNTYAIAKRLNEKYLEALPKKHGISTNCIRLFNVYGTHQDVRMVIPRFLDQALKGERIEVFGCGNQTRDFTHVSDVAEVVYLLSKQKDLNGIFNIARGIETTIFDLAKEIKKAANSSSIIQLLDFPENRLSYKVDRRVGSSDKLFEAIGFKPEIFLSDGLNDLCKQLTKPKSYRA